MLWTTLIGVINVALYACANSVLVELQNVAFNIVDLLKGGSMFKALYFQVFTMSVTLFQLVGKLALFFRTSLALCLIFSLVSPVVSAEMLIKLAEPESDQDSRSQYERELLIQALEKTREEYGDYQIKMVGMPMSEWRLIKEIQRGVLINVHEIPVMSMLNKKNVIPVLVPLRKGTLGYRVFLIHKDDRQKFQSIESLEQLKKLVAGQGKGWGDVPILRYNGINVVEGNNYEGLFLMLATKRFDYFSRGIGEAPHEYEYRKSKIPSLFLEEHILLIYAYPVFFYVNSRFPDIAERINKGLHIMLEDGSFDALFLKYNENLIRKAKLKKRKIFRIETPNLPNYVPLDDTNLWYDPLSLE